MRCPAVLEVRGKRYDCQRPTTQYMHQWHWHETLLDKAARAKIRVEWRRVIQRRRVKEVHECSTCHRPGHNSRTCINNPAFAEMVRAGV